MPARPARWRQPGDRWRRDRGRYGGRCLRQYQLPDRIEFQRYPDWRQHQQYPAGAGWQRPTRRWGGQRRAMVAMATTPCWVGGAGSDVMDGGAGTDLVDYSASASRRSASISMPASGSGGDAQGDTSQYREPHGSALAEIPSHKAARPPTCWPAAAAMDVLMGGAGNDTYQGGAGR